MALTRGADVDAQRPVKHPVVVHVGTYKPHRLDALKKRAMYWHETDALTVLMPLTVEGFEVVKGLVPRLRSDGYKILAEKSQEKTPWRDNAPRCRGLPGNDRLCRGGEHLRKKEPRLSNSEQLTARV